MISLKKVINDFKYIIDSAFRVITVGVLSFLTSFPSFSAPLEVKVGVKFTVFAHPCIINNDKPITVDFGDVNIIDIVNSTLLPKTMEYIIDCSNAIDEPLKMTFSGVVADFNPTDKALQTSKDGLAIKLMKDGDVVNVNESFHFTADKKPTITASLIKDKSKILTGGSFSASATLTAEYQ
jgi:type 1 fimbria pilin